MCFVFKNIKENKLLNNLKLGIQNGFEIGLVK
jgi:hypothetical protein